MMKGQKDQKATRISDTKKDRELQLVKAFTFPSTCLPAKWSEEALSISAIEMHSHVCALTRMKDSAM